MRTTEYMKHNTSKFIRCLLKQSLGGKFMTLNACVRKEDLKSIMKKKCKLNSTQTEIIKIIMKIQKTHTQKKQHTHTREGNNSFFENINKLDKPQARITKKEMKENINYQNQEKTLLLILKRIKGNVISNLCQQTR